MKYTADNLKETLKMFSEHFNKHDNKQERKGGNSIISRASVIESLNYSSLNVKK